MKKLFIIIALLALSSSLFAQGGLTIDNSTNKCGVWVKMLAWDPSVPGDGVCQLNSNTFFVPATTVMTWPSVWAFQAAIGWSFGVPIPAGSVTFQWTDATFQFQCPYCCCDGGANFSNACGPTCWGAPQVWSDVCHLPCTWNPVCLPVMGNLVLTFH
jgi:hypothetical protein